MDTGLWPPACVSTTSATSIEFNPFIAKESWGGGGGGTFVCLYQETETFRAKT